MDEPVSITIPKAEAIVLFDLLADFHGGQSLAIRNDAERVALWSIGACLEKALTEPSDPHYLQILERARRHVT